MKALSSSAEIAVARREIRRLGASCLRPSTRVGQWMLQRGRYPRMHIGDYRKSWDLLETIRFLQDHVPKNSPILDFGACGSELPCSLFKLGFGDVHGIDSNPDIAKMPFARQISYRIGNFLDSGYADTSFAGDVRSNRTAEVSTMTDLFE